MLRVSQLFVYPVKSLGGVEVLSAQVTDRGLQHDRRWMLVDNNNRFISQRDNAAMALLKTTIDDSGLIVTYSLTGQAIKIPLLPHGEDEGTFTIWDDECTGIFVSEEADTWFSDILGISCRLVYMPDRSLRRVDSKYAPEYRITSFSDAFPFLIIGQESMDDLNNRLADQLTINRFRPNIVFTGADAYAEDTMSLFSIGDITFRGVKLCARCNVPTINQETGATSHEPTRTLAKYRRKNNKVYFGQNLVHSGTGKISLGDEIKVIEIKEMQNSLKSS